MSDVEAINYDTLADSALLTTEQAAPYLGLAPTTLENWRYIGDRGPAFVRIGARRVRYRMGDLRRWITAQTETP